MCGGDGVRVGVGDDDKWLVWCEWDFYDDGVRVGVDFMG